MTRTFRALLALPIAVLLVVGFTACGSKDGLSYGQAPSQPTDTGGPRAVPGVEDRLVGTWVAATYQGKDGKTQTLDATDPAQRLTYTFDKTTLTIDWGGKGSDHAAYEWYMTDRSAAVQVIVVHFPKSGSGGTGKIGTGETTDVHYDVALYDLDSTQKPKGLRLTVTETKETTTLVRVG